MPTTVTRSIGSGGDYTTVSAWEAACPADLVATDQIWRGELKNQEFTNSGNNVVTFNGVTTDATRYVELTTEAGASYVDHANFATNPLRYDATKGAALSSSASYASNSPIVVSSNMHVRVSKVQIKSTGSTANALQMDLGAQVVVDRCILEARGTNTTTNAVATMQGSSALIANSAIIYDGSTAGVPIAALTFGASLYNCTLAAVNGTLNSALAGSYGTPAVHNCLMFGATAVKTSGNTPTYTTCLTNAASPPSGCTTTDYSTSTGVMFENISNGTHDLRIKTGSSAVNVGTTDATYAAVSINGVSRQAGQYDVGAWEIPPVADTTPPDITSDATGGTNGPFAVNLPENSTATFITLTSSEALSAVTKGGADGALFTLAGSGLTRTLAPTSPFSHESLPHTNPFVVTLAFDDTASPANTRTVTINVTVTNVNEPPVWGSTPSIPTLVVGTPAGPFSLTSLVSDPETASGSLTYAVGNGSWPPGVTVTGTNIVVTHGSLVPGTYSGLTVTVSDGVAAAVHSGTFAIQVIGPATVSGDAQLGGLSASGTLAQQPGTVALIDFENWANDPLASFTIPVVSVCRVSDGVQVLALTNQNVSGLRNLSIANVAIITGQPYVVAGWDLAGTNYFIERVVAT